MDNCIYHKVSGSKICYLVLYVDDILLATNGNIIRGETIHLKELLYEGYGWGILCHWHKDP